MKIVSGNCARVVGQSVVGGIFVEMNGPDNPKLPIGNLSFLPSDYVMQWAWIRHNSRLKQSKVMCCSKQSSSAKRTFIIDLKIADVNFGGAPFLEGLNLRPSIEIQNNYPLWRSPYDKSNLLNHEELWFLKEGEEVMLVDQFMGIRFLRHKKGNLLLEPPSAKEVASFFRRRLTEPDITPRAHTWASRNLEHLLRQYPSA